MLNLDNTSRANLDRTTIGTCSVKNEREYNLMMANKDKPVKIILKHSSAGFWSIFNKLMNYLIYYTNIQSIEFDVLYPSNTSNLFYGKDNFFTRVFESYDNKSEEELTTVVANNYITYEATGCYANWLHVSGDSWREKYNTVFKRYINIRPEISNLYSYNVPKDKKKISLLIRHPALSHEQINGRMPLLSQYDTVIESLLIKYNNDCIFILATDLIEAELYFRNKYSNYTIIHPFSVKTSNNTNEAQSVLYNGGEDLAKIAVQTVLLLAMGDDFIFPNSNMATAALYINPSMTSHYLIG
jgi:hypothetical protein